MIPKSIEIELRLLSQKISSLETEQIRLGVMAYEIVQPYLTTFDNCTQALDCVPSGFVSYKVREALANL